MKFHIETKNLILRDVKESDIDGMFQLDSNKEVHKYLGNNPITNKKQAEEAVTFIRQQYKERGIGRFATVEKSSGRFIGWAGLKLNQGEKEKLNGVEDFIDVGYRFIPTFWGRGYATEAALASLEYGFKTMNYDLIYGAAEAENIASNKILRKIGLQFSNEFIYDNIKCNWYKLKKENYGN